MRSEQAAPLPRVLRGCAHGERRRKQIRGDRVAPDAAPKQRVSSAIAAPERGGTLAEAAATLHAQARRARSHRGVRCSRVRLANHDTRQARSQRAAWRWRAAHRLRARVRSACRGSKPRDTFGPDGECLESWRERRAPEGESARSYKQTLSLNLNVNCANTHEAAQSMRKHSARTLQHYES